MSRKQIPWSTVRKVIMVISVVLFISCVIALFYAFLTLPEKIITTVTDGTGKILDRFVDPSRERTLKHMQIVYSSAGCIVALSTFLNCFYREKRS